MYGWCSSALDHLHKRHAIGYEKMVEGPKWEPRGEHIAITEGAYYRYFVVWVCDACAKTWWVEDKPNVVESVA